MASTMRGHPTARLQPKGTEETETNTSVPQEEEQADATESKVIANYKLEVDYKPERSNPEIKPVNHVEEGMMHSDTEYAKMEIFHEGTFKQHITHQNMIA